jgi:hypothetical protein
MIADARQAGSVGSASRPAILSAHFALREDETLDGDDGLVLVFSAEIDPMGLRADRFSVVLADGRHMMPDRATLAPANESDENRTLLLVGGFGHPGKNPASHVMVIGLLHTEDGRVLQGLASDISPPSTPDAIVHAERVRPGERTCKGARQAVRTYWTDVLRGVRSDDLARVHVALEGGGKARPTRFGDHPVDLAEGGSDNVLDLCLDEDEPARAVHVDAGTFTDATGRPIREVNIQVSRPSNPR